jgi:spore coat polysaccharide biosynthesis protein SpsF
MSVVATIEARMTSSRFPGKVLARIGEQSALGLLISRLKAASRVDRIVLATTVNATDDEVACVGREHGVDVFRGSEHDVLGRVRGALDMVSASVCVEITGDCPLIDPAMLDSMVDEFMKTRGKNAYLANTTGPELGAPHGLDVQVFEADALRAVDGEAADPEAREHVSLPFYRADGASRWRPRFVGFFPHELCKRVWLSLDYAEDLALIRSVHDDLHRQSPLYGAAEMIEACLARPAMTHACLDLRGWNA